MTNCEVPVRNAHAETADELVDLWRTARQEGPQYFRPGRNQQRRPPRLRSLRDRARGGAHTGRQRRSCDREARSERLIARDCVRRPGALACGYVWGITPVTEALMPGAQDAIKLHELIQTAIDQGVTDSPAHLPFFGPDNKPTAIFGLRDWMLNRVQYDQQIGWDIGEGAHSLEADDRLNADMVSGYLAGVQEAKGLIQLRKDSLDWMGRAQLLQCTSAVLVRKETKNDARTALY